MNTKPFNEDSGHFPVLIDMERPEEAGDYFDATAKKAEPAPPGVDGPYSVYMRKAAAHYLQTMLHRHGSVRAAAKAINLNRTHMHNLMRKLGIKTPNPPRRGNWSAPLPEQSDATL